MWSTVVYEERKPSPCSRWKHAVTCTQGGKKIYLLGGRNGNIGLKDFWRYDLERNSWQELKPEGEAPPCLQEHTAVSFGDYIYVFGGELGFSAANETPLWTYHCQANVWRKIGSAKGGNVPKGRRGHTFCITSHGSALMYGGYCDLKGSSNEMWIFHFETESWHLMMNNSRTDPAPRHKHSAIIRENDMWVYGGMTDLQERSDLWRFNIVTKKWTNVKCKFSPGSLHGHVSCNLPNSMLIFGGERNGQPVNELWAFHYGAQSWQKIQSDMFCPQPMSECCAVSVIQQQQQQRTHHHHHNGDAENAPPTSPRGTPTVAYFSDDEKLAKETENRRKRLNEEMFARRMLTEIRNAASATQGVMVPPRRQATTPNSCNVGILREIGKLSQMNLSRQRRSYQTLGSEEMIEMSCLSVGTPRANKNFLDFARSTPIPQTPLTPSDAAKLVYLDGEEAPVPFENPAAIPFPAVPMRCNRSQMMNRNRRSYPLTGSVRFATPLVTPEEATSDYASCENIHKFHATAAAKTPNSVKSICFENPNYGPDEEKKVEGKIGRGDYVKLNSPADSLLEDSRGVSYEMTEMRPKPPKSLALKFSNNNNNNNGNNNNNNGNGSFGNAFGNGEMFQNKRKSKYRASSAGRYSKPEPNPVPSACCVLLIGGKDTNQTTSFRKPVSIWKLTPGKGIS